MPERITIASEFVKYYHSTFGDDTVKIVTLTIEGLEGEPLDQLNQWNDETQRDIVAGDLLFLGCSRKPVETSERMQLRFHPTKIEQV